MGKDGSRLNLFGQIMLYGRNDFSFSMTYWQGKKGSLVKKVQASSLLNLNQPRQIKKLILEETIARKKVGPNQALLRISP